MADSMLEDKKIYGPQPSARAVARVTLKDIFTELKYNHTPVQHVHYTAVSIERQKTPQENEIEEIARKYGLL